MEDDIARTFVMHQTCLGVMADILKEQREVMRENALMIEKLERRIATLEEYVQNGWSV